MWQQIQVLKCFLAPLITKREFLNTFVLPPLYSTYLTPVLPINLLLCSNTYYSALLYIEK